MRICSVRQTLRYRAVPQLLSLCGEINRRSRTVYSTSLYGARTARSELACCSANFHPRFAVSSRSAYLAPVVNRILIILHQPEYSSAANSIQCWKQLTSNNGSLVQATRSKQQGGEMKSIMKSEEDSGLPAPWKSSKLFVRVQRTNEKHSSTKNAGILPEVKSYSTK